MKKEPEIQSFHFVLRSISGTRPFLDRYRCGWAWEKLRHIFPQIHASILMPNHFHVSADSLNPGRDRESIARTFAQMKGIRWEPIPEETRASGTQNVLRQIRYILLNPCRKRLSRDPLEWEWSSYRDLLSLVKSPWVTFRQLQTRIKDPNLASLTAFHAFVSSDISVRLEGTAPPGVGVTAYEIWATSLLAADQAVRQWLRSPAERCSRTPMLRRTFVQFATRGLGKRPSELLDYLDLRRETVSRMANRKVLLDGRDAARLRLLFSDSRFLLGGPDRYLGHDL